MHCNISHHRVPDNYRLDARISLYQPLIFLLTEYSMFGANQCRSLLTSRRSWIMVMVSCVVGAEPSFSVPGSSPEVLEHGGLPTVANTLRGGQPPPPCLRAGP